jgi:hypothetical protein
MCVSEFKINTISCRPQQIEADEATKNNVCGLHTLLPLNSKKNQLHQTLVRFN